MECRSSKSVIEYIGTNFREHLYPNNFQRQNVRNAFQLLSGKLKAAMEAATEAGLIKSKTIAKSISFVGKMNAIVDVCNSSNVFDKNPMKRPLSAENPGCIEVLEDFITWELTIHVKSKTGKLTRLPCFQALEGTVRGLLGLYSVMVKTYTSFQLCTVICNTDSVEQLFS